MALFAKSVVGLEMDAYEARFVELGGNRYSPKLMAFGRVPLPQGAMKDGTVVQPEVVGCALHKAWMEKKIKARDVILGVSNYDVLVRFATFPKAPADKQDNIIRYQAQDYLPVPLNSVVLDYIITGEVKGNDEGGMVEALLVAAKKNMVEGFIKVLDEANLNPKDIDVCSLALMRLIPPSDLKIPVAVVDLSNEMVNILILVDGIPRLARLIPISARNAVRAGSMAGGEVSPQVEFGEGGVREDWMDALENEIYTSIEYYHTQEGVAPVKKIFFSGCKSRSWGFMNHMKERFDVPVAVLEPSSGVQNASSVKYDMGTEAQDYTICMSLALRGLEV